MRFVYFKQIYINAKYSHCKEPEISFCKTFQQKVIAIDALPILIHNIFFLLDPCRLIRIATEGLLYLSPAEMPWLERHRILWVWCVPVSLGKLRRN
jgi:hypothetical protein